MATGLFGKSSGGVKVPHHKLSEKKAIEKAPLPKVVTVPMGQHLGAPAKPLVKRNDEVKTGQLIAEPGGFISANIHAPITGKVKKMVSMLNVVTSKPMEAIVIETNETDEWVLMEKMEDWQSRPKKEVLQRIKDAGVVGLGGATFPTHVKLSPPPGKSIDTIILNGCECEPYITSDHRVMLEYGDKMVKAVPILQWLLDCDNVYVAIEKNKPDAIQHIGELITKNGIKGTQVASMNTKYPMGAEKTLTKSLLGREVPMGGLPLDVGVVVQNISTVIAIYDAIFEGKALVERAITVTGCVKEQKNLMARFGTPASELVELCGGIEGEADEIIFGGPMMGVSQPDLSQPTIKGTNCILIKKSPDAEERDCFRCASCIEGCPMNLVPTMFVQLAKKARWEECETEYYVNNCVECGSCVYNCPAKIPLVQYIKTAKAEYRKLGVKK
jgi:electron transport complex protein RnfC